MCSSATTGETPVSSAFIDLHRQELTPEILQA